MSTTGITVVYSYAGGTHPTIYGASTLAGPWAEMANAVWVDDSAAGTSTATFPATADAFFYKATTTQTIGEYWNATVPSYFPGGVKTSANDVAPVVYDSTVTILLHRYPFDYIPTIWRTGALHPEVPVEKENP